MALATPSRPATVGRLAALLGARVVGPVVLDAPLLDLVDDSREVRPGYVFFARRGSQVDGARFAADASARGAAVIVADASVGPAVAHLEVADVDVALLDVADAWFGRPQDALALVGVTGTKGKTTVAHATKAILHALGVRTAVFGTIGHDMGDGEWVEANNTTPGPIELRRLLAGARERGAEVAVLEVSSHALDQGRTAGLEFRTAVFTNLASDHLDYHRTPEAYFEAKALLFSGLAEHATAILDREDPRWADMAARCRARVLTYGGTPEADFRFTDLELRSAETRFRLNVAGDGSCLVRTRLVGRHNVLNVLAAIAVAASLGHDPIVASQGIEKLAGVRGRLERVAVPSDIHVFVDYAHTEDALRQVLSFLGAVGALPLACVVGCGGNRDRTKRPRMARVAAEMADVAILTSDNPREEDPLAILGDMQAGLVGNERARVSIVPERRMAIRQAILEAPPGSSVLLAGKGHETWQILGTRRVPFDDVAVAREALGERALRTAREQGAGGPPGEDEV